MTRLADIRNAADRAAALVLLDDRFGPVFDRLMDELTKSQRRVSRERAAADLLSKGEKA